MKNNSTQVPEAVPSADEQLAWLLLHLSQSAAFPECRGTFSHSIANVIGDLFPHDSPPTGEVLSKAIRTRFGAVRVMAELAAKLRRQGWEAARKELDEALTSPFFKLTGEDVPLDQKVPITLLMFESEKTLTVLEWLVTQRFSQLNRYLGLRGQHREVGDDGPATELTKRLFQQFPSLESFARARFEERKVKEGPVEVDVEGDEVWAAFHHDVLTQFQIPPGAIPLGIHWDYPYYFMLSGEGGRGSNANASFPLAFLLRGREQSEVLSLYSRQDQARIATWQVQMPKFFASWSMLEFTIGLHPEAESCWDKVFPAFVSRGAASGKRVLLLPPTASYDQHVRYRGEHIKPDYAYAGPLGPRIILKQSSQNLWPWDPEAEVAEVKARLAA